MSVELDATTPLLEPAEASASDNSTKADRLSCTEWMRLRAKALKKESTAIFYALKDVRTPWYSKILPIVALSYYLCPLDLIPDFIPILGSVDDYIIVPTLLWLSLFLIPKDIMADARKRAKDEPLKMSKNWAAAVVVFSIWMFALEISLYMVSHHFLWQYEAVRTWLYFVMGMVLAVATTIFGIWASTQIRKERAAAETGSTSDVENSSYQATENAGVFLERELM